VLQYGVDWFFIVLDGAGTVGDNRSWQAVKMRVVEFWRTVLVLFALLINGKAEVYIVTMEGEPVISYTGGIPGFEATAVESDEKLDATR